MPRLNKRNLQSPISLYVMNEETDDHTIVLLLNNMDKSGLLETTIKDRLGLLTEKTFFECCSDFANLKKPKFLQTIIYISDTTKCSPTVGSRVGRLST